MNYQAKRINLTPPGTMTHPKPKPRVHQPVPRNNKVYKETNSLMTTQDVYSMVYGKYNKLK